MSRNTALRTSQIDDEAITEPKLDIFNTPTDNYVLSWNSAQGKFEWVAAGAGDMLKSTYDTDDDGIVDKAETVDDGAGNASTAVDVKDAVTKKHSANADTDLDATFEATFVKKVDTVNVLSDITSPGADIEDAVTKKHTSTLLGTKTVDETDIANTKILQYNSASGKLEYETLTTGTPGGADTQVQFNDGGSFGGDANFTWDKINKRVTIKGVGTSTGINLKLQDSGASDLFSMRDDGILTLAKNSGARAHRSDTAHQIITTATWTKVELNAESYDIQTEFDSATNYRFTAKKAGYYQINGQVQFNNATDGKAYNIAVYKNGSAIIYQLRTSGGAGYQESPSIGDVIYLATNDYIELWCYHDSGINKQASAGATNTYLSIAKIR